jgi:hypothetical protein
MDPITSPAVETPVQPAAPVQPAVETTPQPAAPVDMSVDYVKMLADKDAELASLAKDRDNYKKGLLIAKGKLPAEDPVIPEQPDVATLVQEEVQKALFSTREAQLRAEKDALLQKALNENKELKTALANKTGISTTPSGTSSDSAVTTTQYFSNEQIAELKARGLTDEMIKKAAVNMQNKR